MANRIDSPSPVPFSERHRGGRMWTKNQEKPVLAGLLDLSVESLPCSSFFPSSASERSWPEGSRLSDTVPGSECSADSQACTEPQPMSLATAERLYRTLGICRTARPGDVLLNRGTVSRSTLRRWRDRGWVAKPSTPCLTHLGCVSLPDRAEVIAYAVRAGRSTLFL